MSFFQITTSRPNSFIEHCGSTLRIWITRYRGIGLISTWDHMKDMTFWVTKDNFTHALCPSVLFGQRLNTTSFTSPVQTLSFQTIPLSSKHSQLFHVILDNCIAFYTIRFKTITASPECNLTWFWPWQAIYPSNNLKVKNNRWRYMHPKRERGRWKEKPISDAGRNCRKYQKANKGERHR